VTGLAITSQALTMHVVTAMAGDATRFHFSFFHLGNMTRRTARILVCTAKRELRLFSMIELDGSPRFWPMAITAIRSKAIPMNVFARVTSRTVLGQLTLAGSLPMARDAGCLGMCPSEWKTALRAVVEVFSTPGIGRMAVHTFGSKSPSMCVVNRVT
jgi:hypothetical protein